MTQRCPVASCSEQRELQHIAADGCAGGIGIQIASSGRTQAALKFV